MHFWAGESNLELHLMVSVARWQEKDLGLVRGELGEGAGRSAAGGALPGGEGWRAGIWSSRKTGMPARQGAGARVVPLAVGRERRWTLGGRDTCWPGAVGGAAAICFHPLSIFFLKPEPTLS